MENLIVSPKIEAKLAEKHHVTVKEVCECFLNRDVDYVYLEDVREDHRTDPPTQWFIARTNHGRQLKIVFVEEENGKIFLKSAFEPSPAERVIYARFAH